MDVQRQSWEVVRAHFADFPRDTAPRKVMLPIVEHIAGSAIGPYLYPWVSMLDLRITQALHYPSDGPHLLISARGDGKVALRYIDGFREDRQWQRVVPASHANERFDKFVEQLHWLQVISKSNS